MKIFWISMATLVVFSISSCSPSPSVVAVSTSLPPTNSQPTKDATEIMLSNDSSGNSLSSINTPDFSEITPPAADTNPFVKLAEQDLADRLNINPDQIHFLKINDINWQDLTQGCTSTPGQKLTKGRLTGYRIWLEANGNNYAYHIGLDGTIFLCPD